MKRRMNKRMYKKLRARCSQSWEELTQGFNIIGEGDKRYAFKDNGAGILAVAHLDYVSQTKHFDRVMLDSGEYIFSGQLDDRLGAFTVLDELPLLGVHCDILLTDNEEKGASTAEYFKTDKKYNWMFMFDRRGDDAVTYAYDSKGWEDALKTSFKIGMGSFSCISKLEHLGCCGVNIGSGYYNEHTDTHYMKTDVWEEQVRRFLQFYNANKDVRYDHVQDAYPKFNRYGNWDNYNIYDKQWREDSKTKKTDDPVTEYFCWGCEAWFTSDQKEIAQQLEYESDALCPYCMEQLEEVINDDAAKQEYKQDQLVHQ